MLGALGLTPAVRSGARRTLARWLQLPIGQSVAMTANRRVRRCLVVAVVAILGATNCRPGSGDQTSYLATTPAAVTYIRWTEAGSELSGLLTSAQLTGADSDRVSVAEHDITGLRDEDRVTFTIGGDNIIGRFANGRLELDLPQRDGRFASTELHPGDAAAYEAALETLERTAEKNRSSAQARERQERAAEQQRQSEEQQHERAARKHRLQAIAENPVAGAVIGGRWTAWVEQFGVVYVGDGSARPDTSSGDFSACPPGSPTSAALTVAEALGGPNVSDAVEGLVTWVIGRSCDAPFEPGEAAAVVDSLLPADAEQLSPETWKSSSVAEACGRQATITADVSDTAFHLRLTQCVP